MIETMEDSRRSPASSERRLPKKLLGELLKMFDQVVIKVPKPSGRQLWVQRKIGLDNITRVNGLRCTRVQASIAVAALNLALVGV